MKKLLALLLLLTSVVLAQEAGTTGSAGTLDPNQVYTTGNVVLRVLIKHLGSMAYIRIN